MGSGKEYRYTKPIEVEINLATLGFLSYKSQSCQVNFYLYD